MGGGRSKTHNHSGKAEKAPFEFDRIDMIILKSNESTFLWSIFKPTLPERSRQKGGGKNSHHFGYITNRKDR